VGHLGDTYIIADFGRFCLYGVKPGTCSRASDDAHVIDYIELAVDDLEQSQSF
jgi:hypothetical protein